MGGMSWVVGGGGLLGSGILRRLGATNETVFIGPRVRWGTSSAIFFLRAGLSGFVSGAGGGQWQIYWCAGVGVTGSGQKSFLAEVTLFEEFIRSVRALTVDVLECGGLFVASSAGGVYGGSWGAPFDESSPTVALGHYGAAKLEMERVAQDFARMTGVRTLVGRIANLYGPGQSVSKPQGLISQLCRSSVRRMPLSVFVPLDTLRDYLFVDDGAAIIVDAADYLRGGAEQGFHLKVIASGRSVSVGALISEFRQVVGRRPDIIMGSSSQSALQSTDLRLRSRYWPLLDSRPTTNLADGIARTLNDTRRSFMRASEPAVTSAMP